MAIHNRNGLISAVVELGSPSSAATKPAIHMAKKAVLVSAHLMNGATVAEEAGNHLRIELQNQDDEVIATIDTAEEGGLTANVAAALTLAQEEIAAGSSLKAVYSESEGVAEVTRIAVPEDMVGADLHETGFLIYDEVGSVDPWFDIDNAGGTEPPNLNTAGARAIEVSTIGAADDAETIATKLAAALDADAKFSAIVDPEDPLSVLVTASLVGTRTDASDGLLTEASNLDISVDTQGVAVSAQALTNAKLILNYFHP